MFKGYDANMASNDETQKPAPERRAPGLNTMMRTADELARTRAKEEREATEARDLRQDERTDKAYQLALNAAKEGQAASSRTVKMLYALLAASMLANVVLAAMYSNSKLHISKEGVSVGAPGEPTPALESVP